MSMYRVETVEGNKAAVLAADSQPFGAGLSRLAASTVGRVEVWGSSFQDEGPDFTEFRCFYPDGKYITTVRVEGF